MPFPIHPSRLLPVALWIVAAALAGCGRHSVHQGVFPVPPANSVPTANQSARLAPTRNVFINHVQGSAEFYEKGVARLKRNPLRTRIEIDLRLQEARIYDGSALVLRTPVSTGKPGHETPAGTFEILEKRIHHRSSLFGNYVNPADGTIWKRGVDRREVDAPEEAKWKGAPMPFWQRLTWSGVGMHVGEVPGRPASHGCIRFPREVMPLVFRMTRRGTSVTIR